MRTPEQLTLDGLDPPRARARVERPVAERLPVARVALDLPAPHLDRLFDYAVPADLDEAARSGVRVKVRFSGRLVDGYLIDRANRSDHAGPLTPIARVVSAEAVLTSEIAGLARAVADHYAGTFADVVRFAIPPRHARTEKAAVDAPHPSPQVDPARAPDVAREAAWSSYPGGPALLSHLAAGHGPRAVWTALPGPARGPSHATLAIADAVRATLTAGRTAVVVAPDARDVDALLEAFAQAGLAQVADGGVVARLVADDGPAPRYRAFLNALRGHARVVIGTRSAAFAPVRDVGLLVCWNDGDSALGEPHAPYPHARDVLALRAARSGAAFLIGSHGRTVAAQALLETGWAQELAAPRPAVRTHAPRVRALTSTELAAEGPAAAARLPRPAYAAIRSALARGPVLVHVPRTGYVPVTACAACRTPARCAACHGPLGVPGPRSAPQCRWCGALAGHWRCPECGSANLRSMRVGSHRTAEELGRAFPNVPVRVSASDAPTGIIRAVDDRPALVVATPGGEPVADGAYAAALLLDAAVATSGTGLTVGEDALRRWIDAASLVRPAADGGEVLLIGDGAPAPTGALVRWDPAGYASRELGERRELGLPPATRMAALAGDRIAVRAVLGRIELAGANAVLGPVELPPAPGELAGPVRVLVRVPASDGGTLAKQLAASLAARSAKREGGSVRAQLDPRELL